MDNANLPWQAMAEMPDNPRFLPNPPRVVEILAYPAVQLLDVAGPLQVFASANELTARVGEGPLYAPRVVSAGAPVVTAAAGLGLVAARRYRVRGPRWTRCWSLGVRAFTPPPPIRWCCIGCGHGRSERGELPPSAPAHFCSQRQAC